MNRDIDLKGMIKVTICGLLIYWVFGPIGVAVYILAKLYQVVKRTEKI